jgi:hypothetical protein
LVRSDESLGMAQLKEQVSRKQRHHTITWVTY